MILYLRDEKKSNQFWSLICLCKVLIFYLFVHRFDFFISTNRKYNVQLQSQMILATKKVKEMLSCIRNQCNAPISVPLFAKCFFFQHNSRFFGYFYFISSNISSLICAIVVFLKILMSRPNLTCSLKKFELIICF